MTAQELAKQAGMADSTIHHLERGAWLSTAPHCPTRTLAYCRGLGPELALMP